MLTTMPMTATHPHAETLLLALDLGNTTWKLGFTTGPAQAPRMRTMAGVSVMASVIASVGRVGAFVGAFVGGVLLPKRLVFGEGANARPRLGEWRLPNDRYSCGVARERALRGSVGDAVAGERSRTDRFDVHARIRTWQARQPIERAIARTAQTREEGAAERRVVRTDLFDARQHARGLPQGIEEPIRRLHHEGAFAHRVLMPAQHASLGVQDLDRLLSRSSFSTNW